MDNSRSREMVAELLNNNSFAIEASDANPTKVDINASQSGRMKKSGEEVDALMRNLRKDFMGFTWVPMGKESASRLAGDHRCRANQLVDAEIKRGRDKVINQAREKDEDSTDSLPGNCLRIIANQMLKDRIERTRGEEKANMASSTSEEQKSYDDDKFMQAEGDEAGYRAAT